MEELEFEVWRENAVVALVQLLDALILLHRGIFNKIGSRSVGVEGEQVLRKGILFRAGHGESSLSGRGNNGVQIHAVGTQRRERIGVTPSGEEVEGHYLDFAGRVAEYVAVFDQGIDGVSKVVHNDGRAHAVTGRQSWVEAEAQACNLRELARCGTRSSGAHAVLDDLGQAVGGEFKHRESVVEAQGVFEVELADVALFFARSRVCGRGQEFYVGAYGKHLTDGLADAAAVFERNGYCGVGLFGLPQVGKSAEVAEVGLFGAHSVAAAFEEHVCFAEDVAVFGDDDVADGVAQIAHALAFGGRGERGVVVACPHIGYAEGIGSVSAVHAVVEGVKVNHALVVKVDYQAAEVFVLRQGVDDEARLAVGILRHDGVVALWSITSAQAVVVVGQQGMRTTGDDDVYAVEQGCELLFECDLLEVCQEDDLVDARGTQVVDDGLQDGGECRHVVGVGAYHLGGSGRRQGGEDLGGGTNQTNFFAVDGDDSGACQTFFLAVGGDACGGLECGSLLPVGGDKVSEVGIGAEVEVGRQVWELGTHPAAVGTAAADVYADLAVEFSGAKVELVVAEDGSLDADHVEDGNVGASDGRAHLSAGGEVRAHGGAQRVLEAGVFGGEEERAGDEVVARRQDEGVGVRVIQGINHGGEVGRINGGVGGTLKIGGVEELEGVVLCLQGSNAKQYAQNRRQ